MSKGKPSIRLVLYKSKTLKNGEHPIMLAVTYNGKRVYKSTGTSCSPQYWNEAKTEVRGSHPFSKLINDNITKQKTELEQQYLRMSNRDMPFSSRTIIDAAPQLKPSTITLFQLFQNRADYYNNTTFAYNTGEGYITVLNLFKKYLNNKDVELFTIDNAWITGFEIWLRKKYKDTSIKKYFDCIKAAFNYAVRNNWIKESPLNNYEHVKKLNLSTKKRALSMPEIVKLGAYYVQSYGIFGEKDKPVEEKCKKHYWNQKFRRRGTTKLTPIDAEKLSLALFMTSYSFQGLALVDLAKLKWGDLKEITLIDDKDYAYLCGKYGKDYADKNVEKKECFEIDIERSKTGKPVKIVVEQSNVWMYLNPFLPNGMETDDDEIQDCYIFPIYSQIDDTEKKRFGRMKYAIYLVNVNLKRIGEHLGIPNLTFYAARHTYASNLYHADVSTSLIAQNMGRNAAEIETYLKSFEQSKILDANAKMFPTGSEEYERGKKEKPVDEKVKKAREESELRWYEGIIEKYGSIEAFQEKVKEAEKKAEEALKKLQEKQ